MNNGRKATAQYDGLAALLLKFATEKSRLLQLFDSDPDFRDLCEDYGAALASEKAWSGRPDFADQFRCMAVEIEWQVEEILGKYSPIARH